MADVICPDCGREVAELLPCRCAGCDLNRAEAAIRREFGPVEVLKEAGRA